MSSWREILNRHIPAAGTLGVIVQGWGSRCMSPWLPLSIIYRNTLSLCSRLGTNINLLGGARGLVVTEWPSLEQDVLPSENNETLSQQLHPLSPSWLLFSFLSYEFCFCWLTKAMITPQWWRGHRGGRGSCKAPAPGIYQELPRCKREQPSQFHAGKSFWGDWFMLSFHTVSLQHLSNIGTIRRASGCPTAVGYAGGQNLVLCLFHISRLSVKRKKIILIPVRCSTSSLTRRVGWHHKEEYSHFHMHVDRIMAWDR